VSTPINRKILRVEGFVNSKHRIRVALDSCSAISLIGQKNSFPPGYPTREYLHSRQLATVALRHCKTLITVLLGDVIFCPRSIVLNDLSLEFIIWFTIS